MRRQAQRLVIAIIALSAVPCLAQSFPIDPGTRQVQVQGQGEGIGEAARTADAGVGQIGQRQTRDDVASNIEPLGRIDNRVENRIQNRLRNRVDRYYDASANANSPFERAETNTRTAVRRRPR